MTESERVICDKTKETCAYILIPRVVTPNTNHKYSFNVYTVWPVKKKRKPEAKTKRRLLRCQCSNSKTQSKRTDAFEQCCCRSRLC